MVIVLFISIIRTVILYIVLMVSVRLMGKRQVGDMQPGELVVTILISEIATMPIQDIDEPIITSCMAIITLIAVEIFISFISMKNLKFRKLVNGGSAIVIKDGVIDQKLLKQLRLTVPDLMEVLRLQDVFDITEVSYAILETNGNLSVLLKPQNRQVTVKDAGLKPEADVIPMLIVSDGIIIKEGLKLINKDEKFIQKILKIRKLDLKDIFLLTADRDGNYNLVKKDGV